MVVARVFPVVNLASVFLWSRLVDTHARAMLNFYGHKDNVQSLAHFHSSIA